MSDPTVLDLARMIDHSLLHPTLTDDEMLAGCDLAVRYRCATACVKPYAVPQARERLADSDVGVCAVVGFPHGNSHTGIKVLEAERAAREGATEIDMVVNVGKVLAGDWSFVRQELIDVNDAVRAREAVLKVIFETDFMDDERIVRLCECCTTADVAFVKTSTGYGFVKQADGSYAYRGATLPHLRLMRQHTAPHIQIKAAGGVRTLDDLLAVRAAGATRVGATATVAIVDEAIARAMPGSDTFWSTA